MLVVWRFLLPTPKYVEKAYRYYSDCGVVFEGKPEYLNYDIDFDLTAPRKIFIGEGCVITKQCSFLTHDFSIETGMKTIGQSSKDYAVEFLKEIHIGKECFIGMKSFILPGTTIGNNCIIGAGSVVSGNIPDNCVYAGNPVRFIAHTSEWAERKLSSMDIIKKQRYESENEGGN